MAGRARTNSNTDGFMHAKFALSLSPDCIQLLYEAATGWEDLGTADPASAGLEQELADLKAAARLHTDDDIICTLVLPNEHIRYLHLDSTLLEDADCNAAAAEALEAATPYNASELAIAVTVADDTTWVAGVARETLAEAEAFAVAHGFAPWDFAAWPDPDQFLGTASFGLSKLAQSTAQADAPAPQENASLQAPATTTVADTARAPENEQRPDLTSRRRVPTFQTEDAARETSAPAAEIPRSRHTSAPSRSTAPDRVTRATSRTLVNARRKIDWPLSGRKTVLTGLTVAAIGVVTYAGFAAVPKVANFFALLSSPKPTAQFTAPQQPNPSALTATTDESPDVERAALDADLSDEDAAVLDALRAPVLTEPQARPERTEDELRAAYVVTGIWPISPEVPAPAGVIEIEDLYQTSVDPVETNFDAVALPALDTLIEDASYLAPIAPAPAGTSFELDDKGLVVPTLEGALNPDGIMVFAGTPSLTPPDKLTRAPVVEEAPALRPELAGFRPQARPSDLIETTERATLGGLTRTELAERRPRMRPPSAQDPVQAAAENPVETEAEDQVEAAVTAASASLVPLDETDATPLIESNVDVASLVTAMQRSLRPDARPQNFSAIVARANDRAAAQTQAAASQTQTAAVQTAAVQMVPRTVAPSIPSSTSVTREATVKNAINLRRVNLIGVYGKPTSRRALVRLSNGRYKKVEVGDRIDGGRVSAIGEAELSYQKSGRNIVLTMPRG